jgi:hypothetical protein
MNKVKATIEEDRVKIENFPHEGAGIVIPFVMGHNKLATIIITEEALNDLVKLINKASKPKQKPRPKLTKKIDLKSTPSLTVGVCERLKTQMKRGQVIAAKWPNGIPVWYVKNKVGETRVFEKTHEKTARRFAKSKSYRY